MADNTLLFIILPIFGGLVLYWITRELVRSPGRRLESKFVGMGTLKGRAKEEIVSIAGPPSSVSAMAAGRQMLQWIATGYHIALIFDSNGICQGVTHEFRAR